MKNGFKLMLLIGLAAGWQCGAAESPPVPPTPPPPPPSAPTVQPTPPAPPASPATPVRPTPQMRPAPPPGSQPVLRSGSPGVPPVPPTPPPLPPGFKDQKENMSYCLGMSIGSTLKQNAVELDLDVLVGALRDTLAGNQLRLTNSQMNDGLQAYRTASTAKREEERQRLADKNHKAGEAFLAENKKKDGVKIHTATLRDGAKVDMQYRIITEGAGAIPKSNDMVTVTYRGTTIDGKEVDNSTKRPPGAQARFPASRAPMQGWSEAWQMMKVGAKWELFLPSALALRDFGNRDIEPGATLIYEMELTGAETPAPPPARPAAPPPAQPLTSDIIRVPSADEIKKGAKPEIIKAEDVDKRIQAEKDAEKKK